MKSSENEGKAWGHGQFANMPQEVKMKPYPKMAYQSMPMIDDTETRLESDASKSKKADRRTLDRGMY